MTEPVVHLWEVPHPYYATDGNFYSNDCYTIFESWDDFKSGGSFDADRDMNLVYRWDWTKPDPADYDDLEEQPHDTLNLFIVGQRKAIHRSEHINITDADEPEVRAWLTECAETISAIWAPIQL
jgi:hypothetical protein